MYSLLGTKHMDAFHCMPFFAACCIKKGSVLSVNNEEWYIAWGKVGHFNMSITVSGVKMQQFQVQVTVYSLYENQYKVPSALEEQLSYFCELKVDIYILYLFIFYKELFVVTVGWDQLWVQP